MGYINLKERYFLLRHLEKIKIHVCREEQSLITSILGKIRFPDILFTPAEYRFLKTVIVSCLHDAMDQKDEIQVNFLRCLSSKIEQYACQEE
ncbi:hypothetical protein [Thermoactinomyces sp. CICC 10523]|uniref:hypothetical protein n=1 Tax=Thermoactinomyces sp. CICC 10523 TaxID=2767428 RepID=UPI0018DD3602|nr:hypothetical protein [Thermoactinomyces sp. CICC 10523]MBH8596983.1 hypothetical protein [Thermoactinomyces sp. CICC 10523]